MNQTADAFEIACRRRRSKPRARWYTLAKPSKIRARKVGPADGNNQLVADVARQRAQALIRLCRDGIAAPTFLSLWELRVDRHSQFLRNFSGSFMIRAEFWLRSFRDFVE